MPLLTLGVLHAFTQVCRVLVHSGLFHLRNFRAMLSAMRDPKHVETLALNPIIGQCGGSPVALQAAQNTTGRRHHPGADKCHALSSLAELHTGRNDWRERSSSCCLADVACQ